MPAIKQDLNLPGAPTADTTLIGMINSVRLLGLFKSRAEAYKFIHEQMFNTDGGPPTAFTNVMNEMLIIHASTNSLDSSLGGNEVINPLPGFGFDDDIVYPLSEIEGIAESGAGEVYDTMYNKQMQQLHLMFGNVKYSSLIDFYADIADVTLSKLFRGEQSIGQALGAFFGTGLRLAFKAPFLPIIYAWNWVADSKDHHISNFCDFNADMPLYYRMVNSILVGVAEWMGSGLTSGDLGTKDVMEPFMSQMESTNGESTFDTVKDKLDIITILNERNHRKYHNKNARVTSDDLLKQSVNPFLSKVLKITRDIKGSIPKSTMVSSMIGELQYVSFRIEDSDNATESFSNEVGPSEMAQRLNSSGQKGRETRFTTANLTTGVDFIDETTKVLMSTISGFMHSISGGGLVEQRFGNGFFDLPDMWKGAKFTKSHTFEIALRAPGGDRALILQSIYVPLALLLAGVAPRQIGKNMYTNPFYVRAYCKGQFAIPLGIIESLTIKRGVGDYGWSQGFLPTAVDVSMTIRDLSPILYMGIKDHKFKDIMKHNVGMNEYLKILGGVGLREQIDEWPRLRNKTLAALKSLKNGWFNPSYWGVSLGESALGQAVGGILPWTADSTQR